MKAEGGDPWLAKALTACLVVHLLAAPLQIWAVNHLYGGIADYTRYIYKGAALARAFRHFDFSLPPGFGGIVDNGSISIVAGVLFALVGINQAAAFLIMSFLAFIGIVCYYRAFTLTFSGAGNRRYGYLIFFLPSLIFWTADVSKEGIMLFLIGVLTYGCAQVLARQGGFRAWLLILAACAGSVFIRPNEMLLVLGAFTIAMIFRPPSASRKFEPGRRTASLVFLAVMVGVVMFVTLHFLPGLHGGVNLTQINKNNQGTGTGLGSSGVSYSGEPSRLPKGRLRGAVRSAAVQRPRQWGEVPGVAEHRAARDARRVTPKFAHLAPSGVRPPVPDHVFRLRSELLLLLRLARQPGLIAREATVMVPLYLVLLCTPRGPRHRPPRYTWELTRRQRAARRRAVA